MNERDQAFIDALIKIGIECLEPLKVLAALNSRLVENNSRLVENNSKLASTNEALAAEVLRFSRRDESAH